MLFVLDEKEIPRVIKVGKYNALNFCIKTLFITEDLSPILCNKKYKKTKRT
jgi:hypothetical protein